MGVLGVSLATFITYFCNLTMLTTYCLCSEEIKGRFFWFTRESFEDIPEYLKISLPSALMLMLEWSSYEIFSLLAGIISVIAAGT